jgi:NADPH-dependent 2,4-dienoyl-CoA reductase/sulfur reductase-like enzyme/nitrite reductase/ring-hydroxylating ferredoxin subunit
MSATANGPDFERGIALTDLAEGESLQGQFQGAEVVLIRSRNRYFALAAKCTHMGGPLAEGAVIEDCIACPWHHAKFSLATGEAVAAPAFAPLERYQVSVQEDRVAVLGLLPSDKSAVDARPQGPRIVIVGAGAAGYACAEMLARGGAGPRVTLVGEDGDAPYDRTTCSKQYLIGMAKRSETLLPPLPAEVQRVSERIERIDVPGKRVLARSGRAMPFDILVLATGATPQRPAIPGFERPNVFTLRSLRDADAIIEASKGARRVAIVGASFIGLETAASLRQRHLEVSVIARGKIPLQRVLGPEVGAMIRHVHEEKGVRFFFEHEVRRFDGEKLFLDHGASIDADFLVLGLGVTPNVSLAEAAGIACASPQQGGGVLVDEFLATSIPGIFAVGDIACYPDARSGRRIRVEHWVHAQRQGQYLARALLGSGARFSNEPFFWSAHFDTGLLYVGHVSRIVRTDLDGSIESRSFTLRLAGAEHEAALVTCNRDLPALLLEANWEHRRLPK